MAPPYESPRNHKSLPPVLWRQWFLYTDYISVSSPDKKEVWRNAGNSEVRYRATFLSGGCNQAVSGGAVVNNPCEAMRPGTRTGGI